VSKSIRVALFVEHNQVKEFQFASIEKMLHIKGCEIVLVINHTNPSVREKSILYSFYEKMDRLVYAGGGHLYAVSLDSLKIDTLHCESSLSNGKHFLNDQDLEAIKKRNIDLIVKFNQSVFKGDLFSIPEYGIWEYAYGKELTDHNLAALRETMQGECTLFAALQRLPDNKNDGYTIDTLVSSSDPLSYFNNQNSICWKSHMMLPRNITRLLQDPKRFIAVKSNRLSFFKDKSDSFPSNREMIKPLLAWVYKNIANRVDRLIYKAQWSIYFSENEVEHPFQRDISSFKPIHPPKNLFWADPFVIDKDEKSYIFFEDYVYKTKKGHISVIVYDHQTKKLSTPSVVIDTSYHQSYPFIMEHDGEIYMIPEGSKDKDVKLYRSVDFPHKWEVERTFFKGKEMVDITLFSYDGKWWLFANMIEESGQSLNEELYIFYCDDFRTDEWLPHAQNPVISDIETSRPAGKILSYNGDFYRPSQNSVCSYGYSTNFNKIIKLTPDEYQEERVSEITPAFIKNARAIHTYNSSQKLTVIDVLHKIRRF
jgi:hypothetical protein